ncbi:ABC transporter ATP-binding protein [Candidatus Acetothermia bacterium]|nr:ABC transporter ATP-binding protein [Candidatus Acetothermia bacterium]MCI2426888.1 ABC transporter ATP-binding protein [Candidatus Acetothermia bacterium]MCI2428632.1 ABC transporter ATP-binding protein [Candidatus Acetothermia bacterium]
MTNPILQLKNVTKRFGSLTAVDDLSLTVFPGEVFGFLGPNGAGKTTTIKMCTGLLRPNSGMVRLGTHDIVQEPLLAKRLLGYVPDNPFLYDQLTGREFVRFVARLYDLDGGSSSSVVEKRIQEMFEQFEMPEKADELIKSYSFGMRRKVAIAAALIHNSQIVFLDEPTSGLDPKSARWVKDLFRKLAGEGVAILMTTHIMEIAERICDRIGIIHQGKLVALGTLAELREEAGRSDSTLEDIFLQITGELDSETLDLLDAKR